MMLSGQNPSELEPLCYVQSGWHLPAWNSAKAHVCHLVDIHKLSQGLELLPCSSYTHAVSWLSFWQVLCCWNHPWSTVSSFQRNCLQVSHSLGWFHNPAHFSTAVDWCKSVLGGQPPPRILPSGILILEARGSVLFHPSFFWPLHGLSLFSSCHCFNSGALFLLSLSFVSFVPLPSVLGHLEMFMQCFLLCGRRKLF